MTTDLNSLKLEAEHTQAEVDSIYEELENLEQKLTVSLSQLYQKQTKYKKALERAKCSNAPLPNDIINKWVVWQNSSYCLNLYYVHQASINRSESDRYEIIGPCVSIDHYNHFALYASYSTTKYDDVPRAHIYTFPDEVISPILQSINYKNYSSEQIESIYDQIQELCNDTQMVNMEV